MVFQINHVGIVKLLTLEILMGRFHVHKHGNRPVADIKIAAPAVEILNPGYSRYLAFYGLFGFVEYCPVSACRKGLPELHLLARVPSGTERMIRVFLVTLTVVVSKPMGWQNPVFVIHNPIEIFRSIFNSELISNSYQNIRFITQRK